MSSQDGGVQSRHVLPPCTTTRRITANLKTKKHAELPENRTAWKSDNQGFKEATCSSRQVGGAEPRWRACGVAVVRQQW